MNKVCIIAEAGVNHNGSLELARKLVDAAKNAGADYVKFQSFKAANLVTRSAKKADYQEKQTSAKESQFDMLRKLELTEDAHNELISYCAEKGIAFLSTPFDHSSIVLLKEIGIRIGKIPSGEMTNLPYLQEMARAFPELILSTGMCDLNDVEMALNTVLQEGASKDHITVLHCNTEYPTPMEDVNLRAMLTMRQKFGVKVGYSDHTKGIEVPIAAVALGAVVIEKHFTLSREMEGPDHKASLEPDELAQMVRSIRNIELALGDGVKRVTASEQSNRLVARKSLVAAASLNAGHIITAQDIDIKRPGTGISPMRINELIGKKLARPIAGEDLFTNEHFE